LDILRACDRHYRELAMTGCVRFYDGATRWGVVVGDDGGLYMIQGQPLGPPFRDGERIRFEPMQAPGGPRATSIQRLGVFPRPTAGAR
jgi:cold shock CspA family protein